ncbi:hypothetical protein J2850_005109 [Azospirillum picis]|uniref:Uncharacterized protein n=1 Tax=Azospirillum picis TaxID=488438 RepID=A0ABU0MR43_9PROT|nr:hypothetical protein [Azospirillum picis]MDQ0535955.1 hypothetical protein [Azospirillum picis]
MRHPFAFPPPAVPTVFPAPEFPAPETGRVPAWAVLPAAPLAGR